ncbi:hypothetical protein AXX12_05850 [Anaerosporomusa subterranea]|jgi:tripartite-type tricarboxylate transporter receptor subunit TctC|uniref:ABC transporter substrate-binding protein n=1 Tax=Anaerosporomusa subterranea TaxID=1794912 RepID=A0A154BPU6_ANASB|nr:tripartite tricarboxylate transporter substrate binding protein [Anaerosporomusa subterranea]KYZ75962.1 hypothetical protein AXX12_05850 [Anaerosporomusa subterranea]
MSKRNLALLLVALFTLVVMSGCGGDKKQEAKFPTKPVTIISPTAAGGGTDAIARALGKATEPLFGQAVTIVNKPGAGNALGLTEGLNAKPDGYTVTFAPVEVVLHPLMGNVPWKATDFKPVMMVNLDAAALSVPAESPYKTLEDFIKAAKEKPGTLKVGASAPGTIWHLAALSLQDKAGIKTNILPYAGGAAPAITDLLGNHVDAITVSAAEVAQHVKAGKVRILAVMTPERLPEFKDVPTAKEKGVAVEIATWRALLVPKQTPDAVVKVLHDTFKKGMEDPKFVEFMNKGGFGIGYKSADELSKYIVQQDAMFKPLIEQAGLLKK